MKTKRKLKKKIQDLNLKTKILLIKYIIKNY